MEEQKAVIEDAQTKDLASKNGVSADELLQKISEVVKDEKSPIKTKHDDLSKSSDKNFLKKIEEIENEENSESSKIIKDNAAATSNDMVVVGELVMDINSEVNTKKNNGNNKVKNKDIQITEIVENSDKSNIKKSAEIFVEKQSEEIEKNKSNLIEKPNNIEPMSIDPSNISNNIEQMEIDSVEIKSDMNVDESELSPKEDIVMKESSPKNDNLIPETAISIEKTKNTVLIKENVKDVLDIKKEIKPAVVTENTTDSVHVNNTKNDEEKNKIKENGESVAAVKIDDVSCSIKSNKENLLQDDASKNDKVTVSDEKFDVTKMKKYEKIEASNAENVQNCFPENKIILDLKNEDLKTNLNSTPISTPTVFNSTPITKQFEISSENVSKITEAETSEIQKSSDEKSKIEDSTTETECGTCITSESEHKTSDGIDKYTQICKNGIPDTTTDEEDETSAKYIKESEKIKKNDLPSNTISKPMLGTKINDSYEVNFTSDENDIRYFSIEKVEVKKTNSNILLEKTTSISSDQSSYGSVSSLAPFTLPTTSLSHLSEISSATSTSGSQKTNAAPTSFKNISHAFKNKMDLCTFVIEHFTKIKKNIISSTSNNTNIMKKSLNKTPSASSPDTSDKRPRKRSLNATQSEDENEEMSKLKQSKKDDTTTPIKKNELTNEYGECVLAKWIDKKYYAGRITGEKPGNKFVVLFEDGASKTLSKDAIVFGEGRILPLKDQSVYALVDEDDYERGIVISIDKTDDKVYYTVKTDNKTVKVTSSDIYLQENQAKIIQKSEIGNKLTIGETTEENQMDIGSNNVRSTRNKRLHTSPVTPEAGFSGTKGNKRQKRRQPKSKEISQRNRYTSTSEISDTPDESPLSQLSPDMALEAIEGVQPEVQKTDAESAICKLMFLSDIKSLGENIADQDILGPLPIATNIFRNKCFILTCTVGLKPHRYEQTNMLGENCRNRQFSKIPFVKVDLKKQLEAGGGKVYEHFEDIPKSKYRQCKLITSRPCLTAKYIQCLAADIKAISHEWVINCCSNNRLLDHKEYVLPAGWSITEQIYIKWSLGTSTEKRTSKQPFSRVYVLLAAQHKDFIEYWNRVCKMAGAEVRLIKSLNDITPSTKGYLVADLDFPQEIRSKAEHFGIQIVSTVWIVESLILGKLCPVNSNRKLRETFQDDDL